MTSCNYYNTYSDFEILVGAFPSWSLFDIMRMSVRVRKHWVGVAMVRAGRRMKAQEEAANLASMQQTREIAASPTFTKTSYSG